MSQQKDSRQELQFLASKSLYFLDSLMKTALGNRRSCSACGASNSTEVDQKYLVTSLHRCQECQVLFRIPATTPEENQRYYQVQYQQGGTTSLPPKEELDALKSRDFAGWVENSYTRFVDLLVALGVTPGRRVLDYGCSWGYGTWVFTQAGFDAVGYDISVPRCAFGIENLGVQLTTSRVELGEGYDVFFSSHVLEHVPSPQEAIRLAFEVLKPNGLFVAVTPNGSSDRRRASPNTWHKAWGMVHPCMIDDIFYNKHFAASPRVIASTPFPLEQLASIDLKPGVIETFDLKGEELLLVARKSPELHSWESS